MMDITSLHLIPVTADLVGSPEITSNPFVSEVCQMITGIYPDGQPVVPWMGYLAAIDGRYVGTCAFKRPPNDEGVEIAYYTFPEFEGKGIATRMAEELIAIAAANGDPLVTAQTLPEENASTTILHRLGFHKVGTVDHPEDGPVWQFERRVGRE